MDIDTGEGFAHPLTRWLAGGGEQLDAAIECPALSLPLGEYESALRQVVVYEARLASLRLSLMRQAELDEVRKLSGAANTAGWVQQVTRMGRREAAVSVRLAKALDQTLRATGQALADGQISLGQVQVIERAWLDRPHERRRPPRIHPTTLDRPPPEPHPTQRPDAGIATLIARGQRRLGSRQPGSDHPVQAAGVNPPGTGFRLETTSRGGSPRW